MPFSGLIVKTAQELALQVFGTLRDKMTLDMVCTDTYYCTASWLSEICPNFLQVVQCRVSDVIKTIKISCLHFWHYACFYFDYKIRLTLTPGAKLTTHIRRKYHEKDRIGSSTSGGTGSRTILCINH
jgi:hypothetical protein